ncbi:hypothetical protein GGF37_004200 [Kickxella alabastrina]|nr:hypothetical protein GGF37_004200 [Kickxella alabastrina]
MAKKSTSNIPEAICTTGSAIYAANADAMICSNSTVPALASDNPECSIPLGMAYRIVKSKSAAPAAIYSHTAVFGGDLCSYNEKAHYYTRLSNYLDWAASVSGSQPAAAASGVVKNVITADSTSFVMVPADPDALKINVYGGNLYSNSDDDEFGMGELSDDDSSSSSSLDDSAANNDQATAGSMSMGARIGIVVAVLLGIGAVGSAIWYYRKRKNTTRNYMN